MKAIPQSKSVLVVTGAAFEARIAAGDGIVVVSSGGDPARLRDSLAALDASRFRAVISFGLAGGLDPALRPGHLFLASHVKASAETWYATLRLTGALASALRAKRTTLQAVAGVDEPVMDPAGKAAVRTATGFSVIDMETHIAARYAHASNLPWGALRVVCDPAERVLPPLALKALKPDGGIHYAAILKSLVADPGQIPELIAIARDTVRAVRALRRARRRLGTGFGLGAADL